MLTATSHLASLAQPSARHRESGFDPRQRHVNLIAGGRGVIYGVRSDGTLLWYRHLDWAEGGTAWAEPDGRPIGQGFHRFRTLLADSHGQLYACGADGTVRWYHYRDVDLATGRGSWASGQDRVIATGFDRYPRVFGGFGGVIYGVDDHGGLWRHRYTAGDGSSGRAAWDHGGTGVKIGGGFHRYSFLAAGDNGVIYGAAHDGSLHWWRYLPCAGQWANAGRPIVIGRDWGPQRHKHLFADDAGCVYTLALDLRATIGDDDTLQWRRLFNPLTVAGDHQPLWAHDARPVDVGSGFSLEATGALQGYASSQSVQPGGRIGFAVSTSLTDVTASVIQLSATTSLRTVRTPVPVATGIQHLPKAFRHKGCGWSERVSMTVPDKWPSGVYALELTEPGGLRHHVPFVVAPRRPTHDLAFLLPTNTYNAYNAWGGHTHLTAGQRGKRRPLTFLRPSTTMAIEPSAQLDHSLRSDLGLLRWLEQQRIRLDCYTDHDLHAAPHWLRRYKALVLSTHPACWTSDMREALASYLNAGGRLIYTGGHGISERIELPDRVTAVHRTTTGGRDEFFVTGEPEAQLLGVGPGLSSVDFHPYLVINDHPILAGTGLKPGDTFGEHGYTGGASGWKVDVMPLGGTPGAQLIARGSNPAGGAEMVLVPKTHGGWAFSAGSVCFNAALRTDAAAGQILRNVIALALDDSPASSLENFSAD